MSDNTVSLALDLIALNFHVFPVHPETKHPLTGRGHLDATVDPELAATWFSYDHPEARVAIATGMSGVIVLDMDVKNGKNGFAVLEGEWLDIPDTYGYDTLTGGRHYWYEEPIGYYPPQMDYRGMEGVDRKSGSSYVVVYGDAPESRDAIQPAPGWLLDEARSAIGSQFEGGLDSWLNSIPEGEPNERVTRAINNLPDVPFEHPAMIEAQYHLVRLAAEGSPGVKVALDELRSRWLTPPWDDVDHEYEFDAGLFGAIKKAGAEDAAIAELPSYVEALDALPGTFDTFLLQGTETKQHWFRVARALAEVDAEPVVAVAVLWHAPSTQKWSREWQIGYCYEQYEVARSKKDNTTPDPATDVVVDFTPTPQPKRELSLLSDGEREITNSYTTFVDRYLDYAKQRSTHINEPYHRQAAWDILSLAFAYYAFIPEREGPMGVNLFTQSLGKSSSGKSRSLKLRKPILDDLFRDDEEFYFGSETSIQALHEDLLERDKKPTLFGSDESATFFALMAEQKYLQGMDSLLAGLYEGIVPPFRRRGRGKDNAKTAMTSFNVSFQGTPERVTGLLNRSMFYTGFLPRFVWFVGDEPLDDDSQFEFSQATEKIAKADHDPLARALAAELRAVRRRLGVHNPIMASKDALKRMAAAARDSKHYLLEQHDWDILEPSWKRLKEALRKAATLLAVSEGSRMVEVRHVLKAVVQLEEWCENLVWVSREISASLFQRECDEMEAFIVGQGGEVAKSRLVRRFSGYKYREFLERLESLKEQRRVMGDETLRVVA